MDQTKRYELSFRNPEVRAYALIITPAVTLGLLVIFFSSSDSNFTYAAGIQAAALIMYYSWRFFYRRKEKLKDNG